MRRRFIMGVSAFTTRENAMRLKERVAALLECAPGDVLIVNGSEGLFAEVDLNDDYVDEGTVF